MSIQKYSINNSPIQTILTWIQSREIAVPEIQRPFVWDSSKVRDLVDSLYRGYPIGYLITWRNPQVKLKDGTASQGKRILIDGQQRVTALMAALLGHEIINNDYKRTKIVIAFQPQEEKFEVYNPAIAKDNSWIPDISKIILMEVKVPKFVKEYCKHNSKADEDKIYENIELLRGIINNPLGIIELNSDLDIETVTEVFIRINSQGKALSQADFAMSKIAANEIYGGNTLRKSIDYFCHLAIVPEFYKQILDLDKNFTETEYFKEMAWLKDEKDDLYDPLYTDMLRVSFTSEFKRGRLQDLVALLSGRNFETRTYEENIAEQSFELLKIGIMKFMNKTNFQRFLMIVRSSGFIDVSMLRSQNVLNVAYMVYLMLHSQKENPNKIETFVRRWLVLSILTGRYSGSPESRIDFDIKKIDEIGIGKYLASVEESELSEAFWSAGLPSQLNTSVASSPYFGVYLASQVKTNDKGFLSKDITVKDLIELRGDVHHLFPKHYLKKRGLHRGKYNQIANYVMMQSEINIAVGDQEPAKYFSEILEKIREGKPSKYGAISDIETLQENFKAHCIPDGMENNTIENYDGFLEARRKLMALKIRDYYFKL
ncbi:hypothetical protein NO2_1036 [Candidatus Termititenax persephonae]|uniref:GmrSD restriction endonucleases N-terminal domain-containing protein n=1 Tax=Candidatus Termititenax persephonae TaxID=2218525 RepID=A0A388TJ79_9BACT|nr:hypothetical protein NO2_1036 [Candidatus Termititenax persephonae]